jgi:hypothetical protein
MSYTLVSEAQCVLIYCERVKLLCVCGSCLVTGAPIQPRFYQEAYRRLVRDGVVKVRTTVVSSINTA